MVYSGRFESRRYLPNQFHFISYAQLVRDCTEFARSLPPVQAIAGIPRSGLIPASLIALELNVPLISIESLLRAESPTIPLPRRGFGNRIHEGMILVVDDTSATGRQIDHLRTMILHPVRYAAIYVEDRPQIYVDYHHSKLAYEADTALRLFVESDDQQAQEIARITGRPVFSMARNGLVE